MTFSSCVSSCNQGWQDLFKPYGLDLVLQGHNHSYQRTYPIKFNSTSPSNPIETSTNTTIHTDPDWQIFVIVRTGAKNLVPFIGKEDYFIKQYLRFGIVNVDVSHNGRTLTGKFYANNNRTTINEFTIMPSRTA